eukprot:Skav204851  [mRNA]  locus=scaffold1883:140851:146081:+ [translate_table: standard]
MGFHINVFRTSTRISVPTYDGPLPRNWHDLTETYGLHVQHFSNGLVPLSTWYIHHTSRRIAWDDRTALLGADPTQWHHQIRQTWADQMDLRTPFEIHIVRPSSPHAVSLPVTAQIIISQGHEIWSHRRVAMLVSHDIRGFHSVVGSFEPRQIPSDFVEVMGWTGRCSPIVPSVHCSIRRERDDLALAPFIEIDNGQLFLMGLSARHEDSSDSVQLLQQRVSLVRPTDAAVAHAHRPSVGHPRRCPSYEPASSSGSSGDPEVARRPKTSFAIGPPAHGEVLQRLRHLHHGLQVISPSATVPLHVESYYVSPRIQPMCRYSRLTLLEEDSSDWLNVLKRTWWDIHDAHYSTEFYIVDPQPPQAEASFPSRVVHLIILQHAIDPLRAVLTTVAEQGSYNSFASLLPRHTDRQQIIVQAGLITRCLTPDATHHCVAWHRDRLIEDFPAYELEDGFGLLLGLFPLLPENNMTDPIATGMPSSAPMTAQDPIDQDEPTTGDTGGTDLLETNIEDPQAPSQAETTSLSRRIILELAGLIAAPANIMCVQLLNHTDCPDFPLFLEVAPPGQEPEVQHGLQAYGHQCVVCRGGKTEHFVCLPHHRVSAAHDEGIRYYVYGPEEGNCSEEVFVHTSTLTMTPLDHMKKLYQLGRTRAVILQELQLASGIYSIVYHNSIPESEHVDNKRDPTPWPTRQPLCSGGPLAFDCDLVPQASPRQTLTLGGPLTGILSTPTALRNPFELEEQGHGDAWAFLVLGERYTSPHTSSLTLLGWQAQRVIYTPDHCAHIGSDRIGAELAEKEALTWAALWRLSQNDRTPTVFCVDSTSTAFQADGTFGTSDAGPCYQLMRGIFHALEEILPADALRVHHVRSHTGNPWNEMVDVLAKEEAKIGFRLPRQSLDMKKWRPVIPHLWMIFAQHKGLPTFTTGGFDVGPPDLPTLASTESRRNKYDRTSIRTQTHREMLTHLPVPAWDADIESHVSSLNSHLRAQLAVTCPIEPRGPKKSYITSDLWELRRKKLALGDSFADVVFGYA